MEEIDSHGQVCTDFPGDKIKDVHASLLELDLYRNPEGFVVGTRNE